MNWNVDGFQRKKIAAWPRLTRRHEYRNHRWTRMHAEAENKIYMPTSSCEHGTRWNVSVLRTSGLNSDDQGCSCGLETPTLRAGLLTAGPPGLRTSHMPTPGRYALPIFFIAVGRCRVGDGESIAGEEVGESTPTTPECFRAVGMAPTAHVTLPVLTYFA